MKQIIDYIKEGLKVNSKSKIKDSDTFTFKKLLEKYGDQENNLESNELDPYKDIIILDNKYYKHLHKIINHNITFWDKFYDDFMNGQKIYNDHEDEYEVHIHCRESNYVQIDCRIWEHWNTKTLTYIQIEENSDGKFELSYELKKEYMNTEESLVKAFEYMMNMKI